MSINARDELELLEDEGEISQDELHRHADRVDDVTQAKVRAVDDLLNQKEVDLLEV